MIRFSTANIELSVPGDIHESEIIVAFEQVELKVEKPGLDPTYANGETSFHCSFTQAESGAFHVGRAATIVNWVLPNGQRGGTEYGEIEIEENSIDRVLDYGS